MLRIIILFWIVIPLIFGNWLKKVRFDIATVIILNTVLYLKLRKLPGIINRNDTLCSVSVMFGGGR